MSKEEFRLKTFKKSTLAIILAADKICQEYEAQGYDLSLRQLFYQFVSRDMLENTEQSYKRLGSIISDARLAGLIDWSHIKDRGRATIENTHWNTPGDIIEACASQFRIDLWEDQSSFVMVMVEKQALEGVLVPVCRKLDITFIANKGYSSSSMMYELGKTLNAEKRVNGRSPVVLYLGDHDPSGIDMTRDVLERLELFSQLDVEVIRLALNMDQVEEYGPPENPTKLTDSRAPAYIEEFGYSSWELDALEPATLARLVEEKVAEYLDVDLYKARVEKMMDWRKDLTKLASTFGA